MTTESPLITILFQTNCICADQCPVFRLELQFHSWWANVQLFTAQVRIIIVPLRPINQAARKWLFLLLWYRR